MKSPKFHTKKGLLTLYSFACGYVEKYEGEGKETTVWHEGGPCFHVRTHDHVNHKRIAWDVAESITDIRKVLARHKVEYYSKRPARVKGA